MTRAYRRAEPITPDDDHDLGEPADGLYVGGAGDVTLHMAGDPGGIWRTFKAAPAGTTLAVQLDRLRATATTATELMALRRGLGPPTPPSGDWLLTGGVWADTGVWDDAAVWED